MTSRSDGGDAPELNSEGIRHLEETIFSARNFVVPSPDLRPRTLERAKDAYRSHVWTNRLAVMAFGFMFCWSLAAISIRYLGKHRDQLTGPFPEELEQRAASYPSQDRYGNQWRLVEAFQHERSLQIQDGDEGRMQVRQLSSPNSAF